MPDNEDQMPFAGGYGMNRVWLIRFLAAILCATALSFAIHVLYGRGWAEAYVQRAADMGRLKGAYHEPYPAFVVIVAFVTMLLPEAVKVFVYLLLRDRLPGRTWFAKGACYGVLLLAMGDGLLRLPLMNSVIGNPPDVVFVQALETWLIYPLSGIAIALLAPARLWPSRVSDRT